ncbi:hypothetical protein TRFO_12618 [Tritrichomonas foetus]|uniref:Bacterial surface antigen (D15) domain-containing protein n=1 Tax=Tritrichomonas foetus TaxID=1144522 RepID=A0A1J4L117_9EUKA|nr:hypothetical protein TRFO_12618 [Tritrichomonas foetus]|eukprot:OHT17106.1 hypothetical protein TRFO_12618 [Tritrichomonas foetus]
MHRFMRKDPPPDWFPLTPFEKEVKRIQGLDIDVASKQAMINELLDKIRPIKSIKSIEITQEYKNQTVNNFNPFVLTVLPRIGQLPTSFNAELGNTHSISVSTGYSNFFFSHEYSEFTAKIRSDCSPKFIYKFTKNNLKDADFSLKKNCFSSSSLTASYDIHTIRKQNIYIGSLEASYHGKASIFNHSVSASHIKEDQSKGKVPPALSFDPSPYYKASIKTEIESNILSLSTLAFSTLSEVSILKTKCKTLIPFWKLRSDISCKLPFNFKLSSSCGYILARHAVPFTEKFKVGGVPIARGVEIDELCHKVANFPSGCDSFFSSTVEWSTPIIPKYNCQGHIFANGAISANSKSNNVFDNLEDKLSILTFGAGLVFPQKSSQIEINAQVPYRISRGLKCFRYQIGFSPL